MPNLPLENLDKIYFADEPWADRLKEYLRVRATDHAFLDANSQAVELLARRRDVGLRMGINIPAYALLEFLRDGRYKNAYERTATAGQNTGPSATRTEVDAALFPEPDGPRLHYFGAAVLGGTGVRYYGEYCLVLKHDPAVIPDNTQVLDRNSYDAKFPPLVDRGPLRQIIQRLRGEWKADLLSIVKMKILPGVENAPRLATAGIASDILLQDESFVEVHKRGAFGPNEIHEVRESAADAAVEADVSGRAERGHALSPEETFWLARRYAVDKALSARGIRTRIIVTTGRTR